MNLPGPRAGLVFGGASPPLYLPRREQCGQTRPGRKPISAAPRPVTMAEPLVTINGIAAAGADGAAVGARPEVQTSRAGARPECPHGRRHPQPLEARRHGLLGRQNGDATHSSRVTRHSLKKRNQAAFEQAKEALTVMRTRSSAGEIKMAYPNEVGFAQVHPNRCAQTPVVKQHLLNAPRGALARRSAYPFADAAVGDRQTRHMVRVGQALRCRAMKPYFTAGPLRSSQALLLGCRAPWSRGAVRVVTASPPQRPLREVAGSV